MGKISKSGRPGDPRFLQEIGTLSGPLKKKGGGELNNTRHFPMFKEPGAP